MIHPVDYFEENVVMPMMEKHGLQKPTLDEGNDYDYSAEEREYEARKELDDFMNLNDVAGYEHFKYLRDMDAALVIFSSAGSGTGIIRGRASQICNLAYMKGIQIHQKD
jgi:hypothetical protein